jgi:hypothetical protein
VLQFSYLTVGDPTKAAETLANTNLFHFLRTGDSECKTFITILVEECDSLRANRALEPQLHAFRSGGWLTAGDSLKPEAHSDAVRNRTWHFFSRLLTSAQAKLQHHRQKWRQLHTNDQTETEIAILVQHDIERAMRLVDGIATQIYFASGAHDENQHKEVRLSAAQLPRFWRNAAPLLASLAAEPHSQTALRVVQTLHHLLPCAPREVFLLATKAICTSAGVGFQNESLAVGEVVKLIQRALADHREIFQSIGDKESDCLESLLKVIDLFVEAEWPEARQLTHRSEEIYR